VVARPTPGAAGGAPAAEQRWAPRAVAPVRVTMTTHRGKVGEWSGSPGDLSSLVAAVIEGVLGDGPLRRILLALLMPGRRLRAERTRTGGDVAADTTARPSAGRSESEEGTPRDWDDLPPQVRAILERIRRS
jgi:hypothetical protein